MGSRKGRGNQYIQFVRVLYCKLLTNSKQLPAFPLEAVLGTKPRPQRWEARVLPLCHRGPKYFHKGSRRFCTSSHSTVWRKLKQKIVSQRVTTEADFTFSDFILYNELLETSSQVRMETLYNHTIYYCDCIRTAD